MATPTDNRIRRRARTFLRRTGRGYAGTHDRPLRGYLATMAAFGVYASGWAAAVRLRGRPLPDRPEPWDVLLTSVATFRLSVWVASPLTAGQLLWPRATRTAMGALVDRTTDG